ARRVGRRRRQGLRVLDAARAARMNRDALKAIGDEARAEENAPPAPAAGAAPAPGAVAQPTPDELRAKAAATWARLPFVFGRIIVKALPDLDATYNEAACMQWGEAMVPVAEKYGWNAPELIEVTAAVATLSFVVPTAVAIAKARRAAAEAAAQPDDKK